MSYQQVKTPKFYINTLEWLNFSGQQDFLPNIYRTLPVNQVTASEFGSGSNYDAGNINTHGMLNDKSFVAFLGTEGSFKAKINSTTEIITISGGGLVNCSASFQDEGYNGFILGAFDGSTTNLFELYSQNSDNKLGSCVVGTYYDMPHSPDLNLTMTREYGGTKTIETKGGSTISNTYWNKAPNWGDLPAWGLISGDGVEGFKSLSTSGRRTWDLSFSYLDEQNVFPEISSLTNLGYDGSFVDGRDKALLNESANSNFFTEVIHKTGGGALPFIFNPSGENNPDDYAIAKFDQDSFQFKQVANGVYSIKLKIREVW